MLKEYLGELIKKELIKETIEKNKKSYSLTKKGEEYLAEYKTMTNFFDRFGI